MDRKMGFWIGLVALMVLLVGSTGWVEETKKEPVKPEEKTEEKPKDKSDPKAKEMVLQALKKLYKTKGFRFESKQITTMQMGEEVMGTIEMTMKGIHRPSDKLSYMRVKTISQDPSGAIESEYEYYKKANKFVGKVLPEDEWQDATSWMDKDLLLRVEGFELSEKWLEKVQFSEVAKVKDKECQIINVSLTSEGLSEFLTRQNISDQARKKFTDFVYKIWVNKDESLPYKLNFSMEISEEKGPMAIKAKWNSEVLFGDYDKDIEIKLPPEVKELLEKEEDKGK